jgi:hypothetical protein
MQVVPDEKVFVMSQLGLALPLELGRHQAIAVKTGT